MRNALEVQISKIIFFKHVLLPHLIQGGADSHNLGYVRKFWEVQNVKEHQISMISIVSGGV